MTRPAPAPAVAWLAARQRTATCGHCAQTFRVSKNGVMAGHSPPGNRCPGSHTDLRTTR